MARKASGRSTWPPHVVLTIIEALYPTVLRMAAEVPRHRQDRPPRLPATGAPRDRPADALRPLRTRRLERHQSSAPTRRCSTSSPPRTRRAAELVALSVATVFERVELRSFIDSLRYSLPGVRIVVGGPAFSRDRNWPAEDLLDPAELGLPGSANGWVTRVLSLRIAWRFLRSSPGQSALIACGIAVGIATQIFVGSIIISLQDNLLETTIGSSPQVTIQAIKESDPVRFTPKMKDLIYNDPRVKPGSVAPVRSVPALFSNGTDSSTLGLIGGNLKELDGIYKLSDKTIEGKASLGNGEIMIGKEFAEKYNISPGDSVALSLQGGQSGTFTVTGIFDLGSSQFNARQAFVSGKVPQTVLGWANDEFQAIDVQLNEPYDSKAVASAWSSQLPGVSVVEWQGQNASLLAGLTAQSASSYMIQGFVLIAVALGIASTLAIAAVQKTRQIGILKAMGLADRPAGRIFLWQAAILGVAGSTLGVVLLLRDPRAVPPLARAVLDHDGPDVRGASRAMIGIGVAMLSSIVPIRRTSKLDPIEVIQNG